MNPIAAYRERTREKLLGDFGAFCRRAWKVLEPSKELQWNWHHQLLTEYLMLAYQREELRLIFCMPPRGLKSKLVSVFFPAWCWTKSPQESFILTSYSDSLSEELNMARRTLLMSSWYQQTFPNKVVFSPDQNRREQYKNLAGGQAIATSTEGTLTGKGADYLLVDDLLSPQQSYSDLERNNANRFFDSSLRSRLNEPERGVIIVVCQRLHESDLVGHLNENEPGVWTNVVLPMECERDEEIRFPLSGKVLDRKSGDLLHAARWPKAWVEKHKRTVGSFIWACQYQQRPAPAGGAVFRSDWFRSFDRPPEGKGLTIISLDTAFSTKRSADFSVASVWQMYENKFYLRFIWRERADYPKLKNMTLALCEDWRPEAVLVEERGSGQSLLQSLRQETSLPIVGISVDTDKVSRAHGVTSLFESGRVFFAKSEPWLQTYLHELELFPSSAFDDQVDSTVQALAYLRARQYEGGLGVVEHLKADAAGKYDEQRRLNRWQRLRKTLGLGASVNRPIVGAETPVMPTSCPLCGANRMDFEPVGTGPSRRFRCKSCGKYFSDASPADQADDRTKCPKCGLEGHVIAGQLRCWEGHQWWPGEPPEIPRVTRGRYLEGDYSRGRFGRFG
jgi:predicted phage terminase large subunit-like protein